MPKTDPLRDEMVKRAVSNAPPLGGKPIPTTADKESAFRSWYREQAKVHDLNPDPDNEHQFYDYRAAFDAGAKPDASGHWPSEFKEEGHDNMVAGGFNTKTRERVPGTRRATSVQELIDAGWSRKAAEDLMKASEPK